jgi:hypothetical protein
MRKAHEEWFDGFSEWTEGDALENGSQGHAFGATFTGVEKKKFQCALYGKHSLCKETLLTPTCLRSERQIFAWGTQNSSCGHTTPGLLGKDFGQEFSGFERDDLDEHVYFGVSSSWGLFYIQV